MRTGVVPTLLRAALENRTSVAARQMDVEQYDVRPSGQYNADGLIDVTRLSDDVDVVADLRPHPRAHPRVVVDQHDP